MTPRIRAPPPNGGCRHYAGGGGGEGFSKILPQRFRRNPLMSCLPLHRDSVFTGGAPARAQGLHLFTWLRKLARMPTSRAHPPSDDVLDDAGGEEGLQRELHWIPANSKGSPFKSGFPVRCSHRSLLGRTRSPSASRPSTSGGKGTLRRRGFTAPPSSCIRV